MISRTFVKRAAGASASCIAFLLAAPALAQNNSDAIGDPRLEGFELPGERTQAAPEPAPLPAPTPTPTVHAELDGGASGHLDASA